MEIEDIKEINYLVAYKVISAPKKGGKRKKNRVRRIKNLDGRWNGGRVAVLS